MPSFKIQFSWSTEAESHIIYSESFFILGFAAIDAGRSLIPNGRAWLLRVAHAFILVFERALELHVLALCDCFDVRVLQVVTKPSSFEVKLTYIMVLTWSRFQENTVRSGNACADLIWRKSHIWSREGLSWGLLFDLSFTRESVLSLFFDALKYLLLIGCQWW